MTATATSFSNSQRNLKGFTRVLKYAACEWILIFLLFIDAALSYMLTSFANYCELQSPCILCSRLDHIFGKVKEGFYQNLFCRHHRSEISFLLSCNIHDKLVDGRGMCDECLSSHLQGHESDSDTQRLIEGKLGYDGKFGFRSSVPDGVIRLCLCCNKPWVGRSDSHTLLHLKSHDTTISKLNVSRSLSLSHYLKKISHKCCAAAASHVGDTELKITSEFKSGFPLADNLHANSVVRDVIENEPKKQPDAIESRDVRCLARVSENKEKLADEKGNFNDLPGLVSLDDCPSFDLTEDPSFSAALLADLISLAETSNPDNVKDVPIESFSDNSSNTENTSVNNNDEIMNTSAGARLESGRVVTDTSRLNLIAGDRSAPEFVIKYMLAYTNGDSGDLKSSPASKSENISLNKNDEITKSISTETCTSADTDRVVADTKNNGGNEGLKSLPAQNSNGEGNQISLNYLSPELQDRAAELLRTDSNSVEVRNLQNLFVEAITESNGLKPFDESSVTEGESLVDRLDNAREYINALSKELEEERNASAIAAYQAMAMITRLQEEKASLRMEALQYLRMMEEQAEYDVEALEKANDLLTEKERELQDLEAELEYYRMNFPDEIPNKTGPDANVDLDNEHVRTVNTTTYSNKDDIENEATTCSKKVDTKNTLETGFPEAFVVEDEPVVINAWSEIEDEKLYISHLLQKLEKKLSKLAQYGASRDFSDREHSENENYEKREPKALTVTNGTGPSQESSSASTSKDEAVSRESGDTVSNGEGDGEECRENGLEALENEISELNERLEALEADCSFLQHSLSCLKQGKEGLFLIQEILHLLREVKKIGLKTMDPSVL
ncbi:IND1(iron-sulfur protein required for NADH dehydrogenase)-like isoform 1 [Hibiscus syriacus]|uniref:IND1(Iron-sulfur protein required for NADH dehydrogenase)-like isoform 1 n=1 Tax=Hibiscus syriacus TaxID=106335 RepID=A0A6A3AKK8_HIBSY|nr:IND1(iron-sulfur protein required for NADH dehydrogenase)-like isoform 1 [Hibiscus syriacus]